MELRFLTHGGSNGNATVDRHEERSANNAMAGTAIPAVLARRNRSTSRQFRTGPESGEQETSMKRFLGAVLLSLCAMSAAAQTAAEAVTTALRTAHSAINAGRFQSAIDLLKPAFDIANEMAEPDHTNALAALHFYNAVALSGLNDDANARAQLKEFFRLSPNIKSIDPSKFEAHFVALFREVSGSGPVEGETFESHYASSAQPAATPPDVDAVAVQLLGSTDEKWQWASTSDADRARFLDEFWKKRDPKRSTAQNEFRDAIAQRVAIADAAFKSTTSRGALSDRGRVFILLGKPAAVTRRTTTDAPASTHTVEEWIYTSDQIGIRLPGPTLRFHFVTQESVGVAVLQTDDPLETAALDAAAHAK